jgi:hypothetical protein
MPPKTRDVPARGWSRLAVVVGRRVLVHGTPLTDLASPAPPQSQNSSARAEALLPKSSPPPANTQGLPSGGPWLTPNRRGRGERRGTLHRPSGFASPFVRPTNDTTPIPASSQRARGTAAADLRLALVRFLSASTLISVPTFLPTPSFYRRCDITQVRVTFRAQAAPRPTAPCFNCRSCPLCRRVFQLLSFH